MGSGWFTLARVSPEWMWGGLWSGLGLCTVGSSWEEPQGAQAPGCWVGVADYYLTVQFKLPFIVTIFF